MTTRLIPFFAAGERGRDWTGGLVTPWVLIPASCEGATACVEIEGEERISLAGSIARRGADGTAVGVAYFQAHSGLLSLDVSTAIGDEVRLRLASENGTLSKWELLDARLLS